jgi:hypothetical protein
MKPTRETTQDGTWNTGRLLKAIGQDAVGNFNPLSLLQEPVLRDYAASERVMEARKIEFQTGE